MNLMMKGSAELGDGTLHASQWWRFSKYEIDKDCILPGKGALLETFDPWERYLESRSSVDVIPPYQSLVNLLRDVLFRPGATSLTLTRESEKEIVDWCRGFGLLGILPQETVSVTLAPVALLEVASSAPEYVRLPFTGELPKQLTLHSKTYFWRGGRWGSCTTGETYSLKEASAAIQKLREQGLLYDDHPDNDPSTESFGVAHGQMPSFSLGQPVTIPPAGVNIQRLGGESVDYEPLERYWGRFFPKVPVMAKETYQYPQPLTPRFWKAYGEPLKEFLDAAVELKRVLEWLHKVYASSPEKDERDRYWPREAALRRLAGLLTGVALVPEGDERNGFHLALGFPSLFAALGMMILRDLEAGRRPQLCEECGTPFLSSAYQARYCSPRCRNTAQQRRYRIRKRQIKAESRGTGAGEK